MAATAPKPIGREVFVHINVDNSGQIRMDPDTFHISKGNNEQVVWYSTSAGPGDPHPAFTVDFNKNGSPFYESHFDESLPCSGLVKRGVLPGSTIYKYTVTVGGVSLDPGGVVDP